MLSFIEGSTQQTDATYVSVTTAPHGSSQYDIHSAVMRVVNQSESIYQNTQAGTSICPSPSGKIAHVPRRLVVKPSDTPGSSQANILAQVQVPKARVGFLNLEKSDLIPSQVATYLGIELDTLVGLVRPSHKRVTNWLSVAEGFTAQQSPAVQWPQVLGHLVSSRETSALWSNSHSSHSMAIETPLDPVEGEILKTDSNRPSVPSYGGPTGTI